jgi:hypothetical protein
MPYTQRALLLRRCRTVLRDGRPCPNYAAWGDPLHRCSSHGGRRTRWVRREYRTAYEPCTCAAYAWPHRPGGGRCRWPDEPLERCATPAGTHAGDVRIERPWWRA